MAVGVACLMGGLPGLPHLPVVSAQPDSSASTPPTPQLITAQSSSFSGIFPNQIDVWRVSHLFFGLEASPLHVARRTWQLGRARKSACGWKKRHDRCALHRAVEGGYPGYPKIDGL